MRKDKKTRYLAGFSLAAMGAGFLLTIPFQDETWGRLLQGGFEAGLVGGLADWFAVTALFRHPMGIPIPHTALLPRNRNKITASLVKVLEEDWLNATSIMGKLKQVQISKKMIGMIRTELAKDHNQKAIHSLIRESVDKLEFEKLAPFLEKELKNYLYKIDAREVLNLISNRVLDRKYEEAAFDYLLEATRKWAETPEAKRTMGRVGKQVIETTEADGLLKFAIQSFNQLVNEERIGVMIQSFLLNRIRNVSQADNSYRKLILEWIRKELAHIDEREELMMEMNEWKKTMVNEIEMTEQLNEILAMAKARILTFIEKDDFIEEHVNPILLRFLQELEADQGKMEKIESWLHKQLAQLVEKNHSKIGLLVKENLDKLDTKTLINMMENHIGKDIQWIRVNGALCGFVIGLFLTVFKMLVY